MIPSPRLHRVPPITLPSLLIAATPATVRLPQHTGSYPFAWNSPPQFPCDLFIFGFRSNIILSVLLPPLPIQNCKPSPPAPPTPTLPPHLPYLLQFSSKALSSEWWHTRLFYLSYSTISSREHIFLIILLISVSPVPRISPELPYPSLGLSSFYI